MTLERAIKIIEIYHFWKGGEYATGNVCIVDDYLDAKKHYDEALDTIYEEHKALGIYKRLFNINLVEIQGQKYVSVPADDIRRSDILIPINDEDFDILGKVLKWKTTI